MVKWSILAALCAPLIFAQARPVTATRIVRGNGVPAAGLCSTAADVGKIYFRADPAAANSTQYNCANIAASTYAWELGAGGGSSTAYTTTFSAVTGLTVTAATHGQGAKVVGFAFDNATPANLITETANFPTVAVNGDIVFAWSGSKTGYVIISSLGSGSASAGVTSVALVGTANKIAVSGTCTITTTGTCTFTIPDGAQLVTPDIGVATGTSLALTGSFSQGPSPPPAASGGTGAAEVYGLGSDPTANCVASGVGCLSWNTNGLKVSINADTLAYVTRGPASTTSGNGVCWNSTIGAILSDCGFVATTNARAISTTSPLGGGGNLSADRTLTCTTCVVASSPGAGLAHFAGGTQTATSSAVVEGDLTLADVTTKNASTSAHGFVPKLDNTSTHFLNGQGAWTTPAGGGGSGCITSGSNNQMVEDDGAGGCKSVTRTIATTSPLSGGGDLTADRTLACATCVVSTSPGVGVAHFAGSTQTETSSPVVSADLNITTTTCTNQLVSAISSGAVGTCHTIVQGDLPATTRARVFGAGFVNGGSALVAGASTYFTIPYACTISAWNITVDAGTATIDIWKIATGTAIPTVTNTIVASAAPAISTGTALHSTTLTGWTTSVTANDIFGINLKTVATATQATLNVQCDQ